jgi:hypothetical protein
MIINRPLKHILLEYSEKVFKTKIEQWDKETKGTVQDAENTFRNAILNFEKIKDRIFKRLTDNVNPLRNMPTKFIASDKNPKPKDPRDIMNYTWNDMERLFDAWGPIEKEKKGSEFNTVEDAHLLKINNVPLTYSGNGIFVYEGSSKEHCIKLTYAFKYKDKNEIKPYNFCIGRVESGANRYTKYRFGGELSTGALYRSFYFVADSTQSPGLKMNDKGAMEFENWYHFFVIHVFENGQFGVTDAVNVYGHGHEIDGNGKGISWEDIGNFMIKHGKESGRQAWDKIKNHKDIFKYISPSEEEEEENIAVGGRLNFDTFEKLNYNLKASYINKRAEDPNFFTPQMFRMLNKELKNLALNAGYQPSLNDLKDQNNEISNSLARLYAKKQFRKNVTSRNESKYVTNLIPLPFIKYLDEPNKEIYLETFDDNLTFDYIEKYFGEETAKKYVNEQTKKLDYLPQSAFKYINDPKIKKLYSIYSKLFKNWVFSKDTNISEKELEQKTSMPLQQITPYPIIYDDWKELTTEDKKIILELTNTSNSNKKYLTLNYAVPFFIKDENKTYALLPLDENKEKWVLVDINTNNVILELDGDISTLNDNLLIYGYPSYGDGNYQRIYSLSDLKTKDKPVSLKESIYDKLTHIDWDKRRLLHRAGIIK